MRDLIENRFLHEWLQKAAIVRCKEILNQNPSVSQFQYYFISIQ